MADLACSQCGLTVAAEDDELEELGARRLLLAGELNDVTATMLLARVHRRQSRRDYLAGDAEIGLRAIVREDPRPDLSQCAVERAAGNGAATLLVVDGHLDPRDDLVAVADARIRGREADQWRPPPRDPGDASREGHMARRDWRQVLSEWLERVRLAVVQRHDDAGAAGVALDVTRELLPADLVLVVRSTRADAACGRAPYLDGE
jgi:hypothetical protein